ncbi:hypothetical protein [Mesorhizobium sp. B2-2-2]|uniref:hypothetical protein n=1 Tax=Mesorhizobium sp. B2-2-2 TaxID=2589964 RepID=UPI0015E38B5D|nr:hypothetical protein [Mesorhizobium sp. B2-2-2]
MADRPELVSRKARQRSRITNGSATVAADGRTVWVRRLKDLIEAHEADLGGTENLSQAQRSLVRRAATLSVELERMEAGFANAGQITSDDLDSYQRASNTLRRHLESLGLKDNHKPPAEVAKRIEGTRVVRDVVDNLSLADRGVIAGHDRAMIDVARRIAFAVAQAKDTGEPLPESIAKLAVELRLASYADEPPVTITEAERSVL